MNDIIATLEYNRMLRKNKQGQYEIIMNEKNDQPIRNYVKSELLIWVPYLVTKQGGADTLKKPRESKFIEYGVSKMLNLRKG